MASPGGSDRCRSCGAPRGSAREYCLECGARLDEPSPPTIHWLWPTLAALVLAAAGGAVAATATRGGGNSARTLVATQQLVTVPPSVPETTGSKKPKGPRTTKPVQARTTKPQTTLVPWSGSGYTIVLATIPTSKGAAVAKRRAFAAVAAGLRDVGVLVSSSFPGLHPGYFIVFSGIYGTLEEAESALPAAHPTFPGAYAHLVTH